MKFYYLVSTFTVSSLLVDASADGLPLWLWRGFVTGCIAIIIWFIKRSLDDEKEANELRDKKISNCDEKYTSLVKVTAAHEVMYQIWLEEIVDKDPHPENGTRKSDRLHRIITQIAEANSK